MKTKRTGRISLFISRVGLEGFRKKNLSVIYLFWPRNECHPPHRGGDLTETNVRVCVCVWRGSDVCALRV